MIEKTPKAPSLEELRRMYQDGVPQTLISGIEVKMRAVTPDRLLLSGKIPDILSPIMIKGLYEDIHNDLDAFVQTKRDEQAEQLEMVRAIDAVCEAALLEPDVVPFLSLSDRMWIFKLAFMPVEVLSTFRMQSKRDVDAAADGKGDGDTPQRAAARNRQAKRVESPDRVPA